MDRAFLSREAYPIMKEASQFLLDFLVDDGKGHLVTNPSYSPENSYRMADGTVGRQTVGATMDYEIIYSLFHATMSASQILGTDAAYRAELENALKRIPDLKIGKYGQLQEWSEDYDEPSPGMGHMSHLFALFPSDEITLRGTPELAKAARISLERRVQNGGGRSGWSSGWYSNLWARLEDGDHAYQHVRNLLSSATETLLNGSRQYSRSTPTSAGPPVSPKCFCRATRERSRFCRRFPRRGRKVAFMDCERAAMWKWTHRGRVAGWFPARCVRVWPASSNCGRRAASESPGFNREAGRFRSPSLAASGVSVWNRATSTPSRSNKAIIVLWFGMKMSGSIWPKGSTGISRQKLASLSRRQLSRTPSALRAGIQTYGGNTAGRRRIGERLVSFCRETPTRRAKTPPSRGALWARLSNKSLEMSEALPSRGRKGAVCSARIRVSRQKLVRISHRPCTGTSPDVANAGVRTTLTETECQAVATLTNARASRRH